MLFIPCLQHSSVWGVSDWGWAHGRGPGGPVCLHLTFLVSSLRPDCLLRAIALSGAGTKMATRGSRGSQPRASLPQCKKPKGTLQHPCLFHPGFGKQAGLGTAWPLTGLAEVDKYLKEPPSLSDIRVRPHQSASLLNRKNAATFRAAHSQLQGDLFPEPFQRCLSCGNSRSPGIVSSARRKLRNMCCFFLPFFLFLLLTAHPPHLIEHL